MAIVIPRARSSGALSMESNERYSASPFIASTFVIAAVSVVFPWSTCPIVPTFTCGFVRSNFCFAILVSPSPPWSGHLVLGKPCFSSAAKGPPERPLRYTDPLCSRLGQDPRLHVLRDGLVVRELHRIR